MLNVTLVDDRQMWINALLIRQITAGNQDGRTDIFFGKSDWVTVRGNATDIAMAAHKALRTIHTP